MATVAAEREVRAVPVEVRAETKDGKLVLEGAAITYGRWSLDLGGFVERIQAGAFERSIAGTDDLMLLWNHDSAVPLARMGADAGLELIDTPTELRFRATLADTQAARDAHALIRDGVCRGCSFAFSVVEDEWEARSGRTERTVTEGRLFEITLTPSPAYPSTSVSVRSRARAVLALPDATGQTRGRLKARPQSPYTPDGPYSWLRDTLVVNEAARQAQQAQQFYASRGAQPASFGVLEPNNLHGEYRDAEERLRRFHDSAEFRAANTTTATAGGGFALANAPVHVSDAFATAARAKATLTAALDVRPLPEKGMSIKTPRITTGMEALIQATQNADPGASQAIVEAAVESPVTTIYGWVDASLQLLERAEPGFDVVAAAELGSLIGLRTDQALLTGSGTAPELRGLLNVSSITSVAYTDASPTQAEAWPKLLEAWSTASSALGSDLDVIVMHPRRWAWFKTWKDSSTGAPAVLDWPAQVVTCGAIATNQGAGTNEDYVLLLRRDELPAYLGPIRVDVHLEQYGHQMTARIVGRRYASALFARRPEGVAKVSGTGFAGVTFA